MIYPQVASGATVVLPIDIHFDPLLSHCQWITDFIGFKCEVPTALLAFVALTTAAVLAIFDCLFALTVLALHLFDFSHSPTFARGLMYAKHLERSALGVDGITQAKLRGDKRYLRFGLQTIRYPNTFHSS